MPCRLSVLRVIMPAEVREPPTVKRSSPSYPLSNGPTVSIESDASSSPVETRRGVVSHMRVLDR